MPAHPYHCNIDMLIFGRHFNAVHDTLDMLAKDMGPNHRDYYHDDAGVAMIYNQMVDITAAWSAFYHIVLDLVNDEVGPDECIAVFLWRYWNGDIPWYDPSQIPPPLK